MRLCFAKNKMHKLKMFPVQIHWEYASAVPVASAATGGGNSPYHKKYLLYLMAMFVCCSFYVTVVYFHILTVLCFALTT